MLDIRGHEASDVAGMAQVWNEVVEDGVAFPQEEKLGFTQLGTIPGGFRMPDGTYADICPYYHELV